MSKSPFKSSHDELKEQLHRDSDQIKQEIRSELHGVTDQVKDISLNALIWGGSALAGYWLIQKYGPWKPKRLGKRRSRFRRAGESLAQIAVLYLLSIARDKLIEYLESLEEDDNTRNLNDPQTDTE